MNTIIWKGVLSTDIDGLLICELPTITKPPMRVSETTIDGRDGSIIEELGYSSYDKTITIGLHGNFNINNIIKYFTGEGDIIFSNEPDKVYNAKIIGQIDYNRLLRFRTAVVSFRVQPFKHKYLEAYKEAPTATASGTSIVVTDGAEANLKAFSIYGKTTQDGTPMPDVPVELVSVGAGGSISAHICGKNLFTGWIKGGVAPADGSDMTDTNRRRTDYLPIFSATQRILLSGVPDTLYSMAVFYDADKVFISRSGAGGYSSRSFVTPDNAKYFRVTLYESSSLTGTIDEADAMAITTMIEFGDTFTNYEKGKPIQTATVPTPNGLRGIPVSSGGNYTDASGQQWVCDEIDLARGVYVQRIGQIVFDGSRDETWNTYEYPSYEGYYHIIEDMVVGRQQSGYCDKIPVHTHSEQRLAIWLGVNSNIMFVHNALDIANDLDSWLVWLAENPITVQYILAMPIETALTEEEIVTYKANEPTTTIMNDGNAYMKVEYFKPFEVFNEGLENSKPIMMLRGSGTVGISVNGIHIFDYTFPEGETEVVIDSEKEDAYLGEVLKNRNMNGDFPVLLAGTNKIEWSGYVESIEILPRSRWL